MPRSISVATRTAAAGASYLTVMENVLSGRLGYVPFRRSFLRRYPQADVDKAFNLLEHVGFTAHVDKRADALSRGQRQRVGIARALEQDPELVLIDEPTASLDPKTSRQIMRLICEICAERAGKQSTRAPARCFRLIGNHLHLVTDPDPSRRSMPKVRALCSAVLMQPSTPNGTRVGTPFHDVDIDWCVNGTICCD